MNEREFTVDGRRYVEPAALDAERRDVFDRAWLFVAPASELQRSGASVSVAWREHQRIIVERKDARLLVHGPGDVQLAQWRGQVWVSTHPDPPSLAEHLGALSEDLAPYALADFTPIHSATHELACNWKAPLDISLESYHLDAVHGATIGRVVSQQGQRCTAFGDHQRMVVDVADYGWRRWLDERTSRGGPYDATKQSALHRYFIFPNTILNILPSQMTMYTSWPLAAERCRLEYRFCVRPGAGVFEWTRARLTAWVSAIVLREDLPVLRRFQQGVGALGEAPCQLHQDELPVARFHRSLARWMAPEQPEVERPVTGVG